MDILAGMREVAEARAERLQPIPLHKFFSIRDLTSMTWIGTFAWSNQAMKQRWLHAGVLVDLFEIPQVPPEIARDYLRVKYTKKRRHTIDQFKSINEHRAAPLYAKIGIYSDMALVDITSAYWSIVRLVGWDVDYYPTRWLGKRSENDDFPLPNNKIARNCLVSAGLVTKQYVWTGQKISDIGAHNPYINYDIWALAQDVLNSIATLAIRMGAVHVHTDGYIVPRQHKEQLIAEIQSWGLGATVKAEGDCIVKGVGSYSVGDKGTKKLYAFTPSNLNKVYEPDIAWLKPRIAKLARSRIDWSKTPEQE